jgi:uncharacterized pyridoxal phosphate-containing UPF0001 family protein
MFILCGVKFARFVDVGQLHSIETVDSEKLAKKLNDAFKDIDDKLDIFIQVIVC